MFKSQSSFPCVDAVAVTVRLSRMRSFDRKKFIDAYAP